MLGCMFQDVTRSDADLRRFLHALPPVDEADCDRRAATWVGDSPSTWDRGAALDLAIRMVDLTTLEGTDTPERVRALAARALNPDPDDATCPSTAAVCVYGDMVAAAREVLQGTAVRVAAVAGAFPSGRAGLEVKVADVAYAVATGADEIDVVIDRGAFLDGRYLQVYEHLIAMREACKRPDGTRAHLKVILETGELRSYTVVLRASWLAMLAGADFVKTSTGKVQPAATFPSTLVMMDAVRAFRTDTGHMVGIKPAGGIRRAGDALTHLAMAHDVLGPDWLAPRWFRFGASSLLDDLLLARSTHLRTVAGNRSSTTQPEGETP